MAPALAPITLELLGPFTLEAGGVEVPLSKPARQVAALLALAQGKPVGREAVASKIWPDTPPERSRFYLRRILPELRASLAGSAFVTSGDSLALDESVVQCSLTSLLRKLEKFRQPLVLEDAERERIMLPLLQGLQAPWLDGTRNELSTRLAQGLLTASHQRIADQLPEDAVDFLELAISIEPYREQLWRALFRALAAAGNYAQIPVSFKTLRRRFALDLDLAPTPETDALVESLLRNPPFRPQSLNGKQLPYSGEPFVGHRDAVETLESLRNKRAVTIVGVGGMGKTRLASYVAERRGGGVFWFSLGGASSSSLLATVAETFKTTDLESAILQRLKNVSALFVVDNAESASSSDRAFVSALLDACPGITVLATSRELMGIPEEHPFPIPPVRLDAADPDRPSDAFELLTAYLPDQGRRLSPKDIADINAICDCLGGVPLALKLAGLKIQSLSPDSVLAGLRQDVGLIDSGGANHAKSIRAAYEWSYSRLKPGAQRLFAMLSPLEFAWPADLVPALDSSVSDFEELVLSGLVIGAGDRLFRSVNPLRQLALRSLSEGAAREARSRIVTYYETALDISASRSLEAGLRFSAEELLTQGSEPEAKRGRKLAETLSNAWEGRGDYAVAAKWQDEFIFGGALASDLDLAPLLLSRARCAAELYDLPGAIGFFERGIAVIGNPEEPTELEYEFRIEFSGALANQESWAGAERESGLALEIARKLDNPILAARAMQRQAYVAGERRDFESAHRLLNECLRILAAAGDAERLLSARETLGVTLLNEDRRDEAEQVLKDCDAHRLRAGQDQLRHWLLNCLGDIAMRRGDYAEAITYADEALSILCSQGHSQKRVYSLQNQAWSYAELGDDAKAIELLEEVVTITAATGMDTSRLHNLCRLVEIYEKRGDLFTARAYLSNGEPLLSQVKSDHVSARFRELRERLNRA